jgi:hypothetical protein
VTGTFGLIATNAAKNRSFATTYTVNAANVWEYKVITVKGDVTGTWAKNNTTGLDIIWSLGAGSGASMAAGAAWNAGGFYNVTGAVQFVGSAVGSTFALTNVSVEKGGVATPFEVRPYAVELGLCMRYYTRFDNNNNFCPLGICIAISTTEVQGIIHLPVSLRVSPTLQTSAGTGLVTQGTTTSTTNDVYAYINGIDFGFTTILLHTVSPSSSVTVVSPRLTGGSGLVAASPGFLYIPNTSGKFFALIAEL